MSQIPPPLPPSTDPIPAIGNDFKQIPPTIPGALRSGVQPHRGGLVLGLGVGSLGIWLLGAIGAVVVPGCCGSFIVSLALAIPAWILANTDLAAMRAGTMDASGQGMTQGGRLCAIISVIIHALTLLVTLLLLVVGLAAFGFAASHHP